MQCDRSPTAEWTLQQFREGLSDERPYRFAIHDRDSIFSAELDQELVEGFGLRVLRTPPQSPQANAFCERLVGTIRRECLDFMIPVNERHLRRLFVNGFATTIPGTAQQSGARHPRGSIPRCPATGHDPAIHAEEGTGDLASYSRWTSPRVCVGRDDSVESAER